MVVNLDGRGIFLCARMSGKKKRFKACIPAMLSAPKQIGLVIG